MSRNVKLGMQKEKGNKDIVATKVLGIGKN